MPAPTWRDRLPLALALSAIVLAVLGLTPVGQAASDAIDRVLYARDASSVAGLRVSRTPRPNRLLPLRNDARFPESVVPRLPGMRGPQGTTGEVGATGPAGTDGGRAIVVLRDDPIALPADQQPLAVATLDDLEPGAFVLNGMVEVSSPEQLTTPVRCTFLAGERELGSGIVTVGTAVGGAAVASLPVIGALSHSLPQTVRLSCTAQVPGHAVDIERAQVAALSVASVENLEVTQ
jgi:hypothetical protein